MNKGNSKRAGFTLVEFMIGASLLGILLSSAAMVSRQSMQAIKASQLQTDLEDRARRSADRLVAMLENTNAIIPAPAPAPLDDFVFTRVTGVDGAGGTTSTPQARVFWRYSAGELDDGLDNNGNGLVDEGEVVYTRDFGLASERTNILCKGVPELLSGELLNGADDNGNGLVDESGFCVVQVGDILVVRLSVEAVSIEGEAAARTIETGVHLRD